MRDERRWRHQVFGASREILATIGTCYDRNGLARDEPHL
jgi:hypothetical protein